MTEDDAIRVLHVEDDRSFAELTAELLTVENEDFEVVSATDAVSGLEILDDRRVDCVVSDYEMPGMDGVAFLQAVRDRDDEVPFIVFTGKGSEEVARDALRSGATDYLRKQGGADKVAVLANRIRDAVEKRRAERRLSEVRDRYRNLVETAPVPVAVHVQREIVYANPAAADFLAAERPEQLVGHDVMEFVHPEDRDLARRRVEQAIEAGKADPVEERLVDLDGEVRPVMLAAATTTYDGRPAIQVVGQDLTEIKERERELQRERDRFSALFENVPDPAVDARFEDGEPIVVDVNPAFEGVFGYDADTLRGESLNEYIVPADDRESARAINDDVSDGQPMHQEVTRETADGSRDFLMSLVPQAIDGAVTRGFGIYTDITERKTRERKLENLHEAARELMEAETVPEVAEVGIVAASEILDLPFSGVFLDDGDGTLRAAALSAEARERFGEVQSLAADGSVAGSVYESGDPVMAADIREHDNLANPDTEVRSEMILPLGDHGVLQAGSTTVDDFTDTDRSLAPVLAANVQAALDRAERETALRERREQVERQNERLEEFASVVSHDLRNPLEQARGYLGLAMASDPPDTDHLEVVEEGIDRIEEIIDDVLTLARQGGEVDDEETEPVDLALLALNCWEMVSTSDLEIEVRDPPQVLASEGRLRQLLENLFRNAVEHGSTSPRSNAREDAVEHADSATRVRVGAIEGDDHPRGFFVADDGPGIDPETREKVFDSQFSTEADNTGFGLTIVEEVAEAHGWEVSVTESETGGARFEVTGVEVPAGIRQGE